MAFSFPADCKTDREKALYALAVKAALIDRHNATHDMVEKDVCCLKLRIVCALLSKLRAALGADKPGTEAVVEQLKADATAARVTTPAKVLNDIDYITDKALTV